MRHTFLVVTVKMVLQKVKKEAEGKGKWREGQGGRGREEGEFGTWPPIG